MRVVPPSLRPLTLGLLFLAGIPSAFAQPAITESVINQPIFTNRIEALDEIQILDWLSYRGRQDILEALGGGKFPPETPVSRLRLTFKKAVRLDRIPHVVCVFESSGFIHGGAPSPLIVLLMNLDYEVLQWARLDACDPMGAAFVRYVFGESGAPWDGKNAELVLVGQSGRSLTGSLYFYRVSLSREKIAFVGESNEWKPKD